MLRINLILRVATALLLAPFWCVGPGNAIAAPVKRAAAASYFHEALGVGLVHRPVHGITSTSRGEGPVATWFDQVSETNSLGIDFQGYFDQGVTLNMASPDDRKNGPIIQNYRSNAYQMNGLYLISERKIDSEAGRWQLGGRCDLLYGTDGSFGGSLGFDEKLASSNRFYNMAIPQLYANIFIPAGNGWSIKVGKYFCPVGNEWIMATPNFFYSHFLSYGLQPGTHTGMMVETNLTERWEIRAGPNLGWNTSEHSNQSPSFGGSTTYKLPELDTNIYFAWQTGRDQGEITVADAYVTNYSLIINTDLTSSLHWMLEHDLLVSRSQTGLAADDFETWSITNYLFYQIGPEHKLGLRVEWLDDSDGIVSGYETTRPSAPSDYVNISLGVNWTPARHLRFRPEIRYDKQFLRSGASPPAFDDGTSTEQWLLAADLLWTF